MNEDKQYQPAADFVSKTMRRVYAYESSKKWFAEGGGLYVQLQRCLMALGGALFGILNATRVF